MSPDRVLLVDSWRYWPASPLFGEALAELAEEQNFEWSVVDDSRYLRGGTMSRIARKLDRQAPGSRAVNEAVLSTARRFSPNLIVIVKGAYLAPATLRKIRAATSATLVNFATDDPWNPRASSRELLASIPHYDFYVCTKRAIVDDVTRAGARRVSYLPFGYKPTVHFRETPKTDDDRRRFGADVAFIGGADADRTAYLHALLDARPKLQLALWGGYWDRWPRLRPYWRGAAIGRDYRLAISGASVVINLVRRANRDGHVMRTFEVPACGGCMVAERTTEHGELFPDGKEARFFSSPQELVHHVDELVADESARTALADSAVHWAATGAHTYRDRLAEIIRLAATG